MYLLSQIEAGVGCPISMTYAGFPVLRRYLHQTSPKFTESFPLEKLQSRKYDRRCVPAKVKSGLTIGQSAQRSLVEKRSKGDFFQAWR